MTAKVVYSGIGSLPLILKLNSGGEPLGWINYEDCAYHYAKDNVIWSLGAHEVLLRGGTNAETGLQSRLVMDSIIAIRSNRSPTKSRNYLSPPLTNRYLFARDKNLCAYCGHQSGRSNLTRDHVTPKTRGGKNTWDNVVTACKGCNQWKADKLLTELDVKLLYVPYTPTYNEFLILQNRNILGDQMEFLLKGVSKNSRLHS